MEIKERPICRQTIVKNKLRPNVVDGIWDRNSCLDNGKFSHMSDGMRIQMHKMILEGHWGEGIIIAKKKDWDEKYYNVGRS